MANQFFGSRAVWAAGWAAHRQCETQGTEKSGKMKGDPGRRAAAGAPVSAGRRVGERGTSDNRRMSAKSVGSARMEFCLPWLHCSLPPRPGLAIAPRWRRRAALPCCVLKGSEPSEQAANGILTGAEPLDRMRTQCFRRVDAGAPRGGPRSEATCRRQPAIPLRPHTQPHSLPRRYRSTRHHEQQQLLLLPACPLFDPRGRSLACSDLRKGPQSPRGRC